MTRRHNGCSNPVSLGSNDRIRMKFFWVLLAICLVSPSCQRTQTHGSQPNAVTAQNEEFDYVGKYKDLSAMMIKSATNLMECHQNTQESLHYMEHPRTADDLEKSKRNLARFAQIIALEGTQIERYADLIRLFPVPPSRLVEAKSLLMDMHVSLESMADLMSVTNDGHGNPSVKLTGDAESMKNASDLFLSASRRLKLTLP